MMIMMVIIDVNWNIDDTNLMNDDMCRRWNIYGDDDNNELVLC